MHLSKVLSVCGYCVPKGPLAPLHYISTEPAALNALNEMSSSRLEAPSNHVGRSARARTPPQTRIFLMFGQRSFRVVHFVQLMILWYTALAVRFGRRAQCRFAVRSLACGPPRFYIPVTSVHSTRKPNHLLPTRKAEGVREGGQWKWIEAHAPLCNRKRKCRVAR